MIGPKLTSKRAALFCILALAAIYLSTELERSKEKCRILKKYNSELSPSAAGKSKPILICACDIPAGTIISRDMVTTKILPVGGFAQHFFVDDSVAIGREMLWSQKKDEPIDPNKLGFSFGSYVTSTINESKKFNLFIGLATPTPSKFTLEGHKITVEKAWLSKAPKDHVRIIDPNTFNISFILKIDRENPGDGKFGTVCCTAADSKSGEDEIYYQWGSTRSDVPFVLKIPARRLTRKMSFKLFLAEGGKGNQILEPKQQFQVITFSLPQH